MSPVKTGAIVLILIGAVVVVAGLMWYYTPSQTPEKVTSFEECVQAGYPVMESYPAQCRTAAGQTFTQDIGNELEKHDLIRIDTPRPNTAVTDPITITGTARGPWFFEASFPVHLETSSGQRIASTPAQAQAEWMTTEFVPFTAELDIPDTFSGIATLVLEKSNPSGLPEHADALLVPIIISQ